MDNLFSHIPVTFIYWQINNFIFWLLIGIALIVFRSLTPRQKKWLILAGFIKSFLPPVIIPWHSMVSMVSGQAAVVYYPQIIVNLSRSAGASFWPVITWALAGFFLAVIIGYKTYKIWQYKSNTRKGYFKFNGMEVPLYYAKDQTGPGLVGFFPPVIVVPANFDSWEFTDRQLAIAHELAHLHGRDYLVHFFKPLVLIINIFNPLVWYLMRILEHNIEILADAAVIRSTGTVPDAYYGTILKIIRKYFLSEQVYTVQFSLASSYTSLRARLLFFKNLKEEKLMKNWKMIAFLFIPLMFLMFYMACSSENQDSNATATTLKNIVNQSDQEIIDYASLDRKPACDNLNTIASGYPDWFRSSGIEGTILAKLIVDETGKVVAVTIIKNDLTALEGHESRIKEMEQEVIQRAEQLKWEPGLKNGKTVKTSLVMPVTFRLD